MKRYISSNTVLDNMSMKSKKSYINDYLETISIGEQFIAKDVVNKLARNGYYITSNMIRKYLMSSNSFKPLYKDNKLKATIWEKVK